MTWIIYVVVAVVAFATGLAAGFAYGVGAPRIPPDPRDTRGCEDADLEWARLTDAQRIEIIERLKPRR